MIETISKYDYIKKILKDRILNGDFPPGSKIPTEPELVTQYGVGRNTVRETICALAHEGLLKKIQGKGTYVTLNSNGLHSEMGNLIGMASFFRNETMDSFNYIQDYVLDKGGLLVIYNVNEDLQSPLMEKKFLEKAEKEKFKGLIVLPTPHKPLNSEIYKRLRNQGIKVALLAPYKEKMDDEVTFLYDYHHAGYMTAAKMSMAGFKKICFARKNLTFSFQQIRNGIALACNDFDLELLDDFHFMPDRNNEKHLKQLPQKTGIISSQTSVGYAIYDLIIQLKLRMPDDIALCSVSEYKKPNAANISCIASPHAEQLKAAVDYIFDTEINADEIIHKTFKFKYEEHGTVEKICV